MDQHPASHALTRPLASLWSLLSYYATITKVGFIVWHTYIFRTRHNWLSTSCTPGTEVAGRHWVCCAPCINKVNQDKIVCGLVGNSSRFHNDAMTNRVTLELGMIKLISGCDKQLFCIVLLIL